jgi:hypothetical protein
VVAVSLGKNHDVRVDFKPKFVRKSLHIDKRNKPSGGINYCKHTHCMAAHPIP